MILVSLLPALAYLLLLKAMDAFSLIQWRRLSMAIVYGVCCSAIVFFISRAYVQWTGTPWEAIWISPLIEECLKALPLLVIVASSHRIAFQCEAMIYGAAVGAGFSLVENSIYLYCFPDMLLVTAIIRGFSTALLHLGCTVLAASLALLLMGPCQKRRRFMRLIILTAILPSWLLHTLHNSMLLDPMFQTFVVITSLLLMFYFIALWSERSTEKWLDVTITTHVQLLTAMREGRLCDTAAGHYLLTIKRHCDAEVFFDIIVYMQLYMELLVEAKSRVMLHEVGMKAPLTDRQRVLLTSKISELHTLQQRIPILQRQLLHPLICYNRADSWAIDRLLD